MRMCGGMMRVARPTESGTTCGRMAVHAAPSAGGAPRDVLATLGNNRVARVPGRLPAPGSFNRATTSTPCWVSGRFRQPASGRTREQCPESSETAVRHHPKSCQGSDKAGRVTLRYLSRLRHIGVGRHYIGARITLLVAGTHIRVVDEDGRLIRELTLDPARDYQPLGTPTGRPKIGHYVPRQVGTIT